MTNRLNGAMSAAVLALATIALAACTSTTSGTGGPSGGSSGGAGSTTQACTYGLFAITCQTYTGNADSVSGDISACEKVFGGAEVASCPSGAIGYCKGITSGDTTSEIYYYPGDAGTLTFQDLCTNAGGTFSATP
jgi:hypothetical protein